MLNTLLQRLGFRAVVVPGRLKAADHYGNGNTDEQSQRQFATVVSMKLQFRQQITRGNAQKGPGSERERGTEEMRRRLQKPAGTQIEQKQTRRIGERKQAIDPVAQRPRRPAYGQQCADRQRVKRFVEKNHEKGSESEQAVRSTQPPVKLHAGGKRDAIQ